MTTRPLLISADPDLIDDVVRLSAVAGVEVHVAPDPAAARVHWSAAPLVLVGRDVTTQVAIPGRRDGVVLVEREHDPQVWQQAVAIGAEHVASLPEAEPWLVERLGQSQAVPRGAGRLITVIGAGGGAGASTFAATVSLAAASDDQRVLLVDGDPLGGGIDVLMGIESETGPRWADLPSTTGRIATGMLAGALPRAGGVSVLSFGRTGPGEMPRECLASVLDAARRDYDLVIVDLARTCLGSAATVVESSDLTVIVASNHVRSVSATARLAAGVRAHSGAVAIAVRVDPDGVQEESVPRLVDLPLLATLPASSRLTARSDEGELPVLRDGYGRACRSALVRLRGAG